MGRMCDFIWQRSMDGGGGGDLADIIHDVVSGTDAGDRWQLPKDDDAPFQNLSEGDCSGAFDQRDPLLNELAGAAFSGCSDGNHSGNSRTQKPVSLFPRLVQISPAKPSTLSRGTIRPFPAVTDHSVRIVSSPSAGMIKRRKDQAKKVVCIPAPTAANNRTISGEVVPSDLWAWRKYGQKPIKGSPLPRSYYRCSSSKGCSARKQVERSRCDPNMLVITYTSEHNHPWPTQRNALAGSTRSSSNPRRILPPPTKNSNLKEEPVDVETSSSSSQSMAKEESMAIDGKLVFYKLNDPSSDFFTNLMELESDPNEGVDPFANMFDWEGSTFGDD